MKHPMICGLNLGFQQGKRYIFYEMVTTIDTFESKGFVMSLGK